MSYLAIPRVHHARPLQYGSELHQKDLRINLVLVHILGPETELFYEADTFLALSLIVANSMPRDPFSRRRVDIPVIRPCKLSDLSQNVRIRDI